MLPTLRTGGNGLMARELRSWGRRIGGLWADGNGGGTPPGHYGKLSLFTFSVSVFCLNFLVLLYYYVAASYGYLEIGVAAERENIPVERLTAALFAVSGLTLFLAAAAAGRGWLRRFYILVGLGALFVAGEEVSWGQHIFGFVPPDFLVSANIQDETNFHNTVGVGPVILFLYNAILPWCYLVPIAAFCVRKYRLGSLPLPSLWLAFFFAMAANFDGRYSWLGVVTLQGHLLVILGIFLGAALFARDKKLLMVVGTIIAVVCSLILAHGNISPNWLNYLFSEVQEYLLGLAGFLYSLQLLRDSGGERWLARQRWVKAAWFRPRGHTAALLPPPLNRPENIRQPGPDWARHSWWWAWPAACLLVVGFAGGVAALDWQLAAAQGREYQRMTAAPPTAQAHSWSLYHTPGRLTYLEPGSCPRRDNLLFFLHIVPIREDDLPAKWRGQGFLSRDFSYIPEIEPFRFPDGGCLATILLPDYPIAYISTGHYTEGGALWEIRLDLDADHYRAAYQPIAAGQAGPPLSRAEFNLYRYNNALYYFRESCAPADTAAPFFLHIVPIRVDDLPAEQRPHGFSNHDFDFNRHGHWFDGKCLAVVELPDYPIAEIRTGQQVANTPVWTTRLNLAAEYYRAAYQPIAAGQAGPPLTRAEFDLYRYNNALYYFRESCAPADTAARFFLHLIPENPADLPAARQALGFANRDFDFNRRGQEFDGKCLAVVELPDYPLAEIRTGQFTAAGPVWEMVLPAGN